MFTDRDFRLFRFLYIFNCLYANQVLSILGMNSIKVCQRRLRKLCAAGYLERMPMPRLRAGKPSFLYYLSNMAASMLDAQVTKPRISWQLSHQVKNNGIMINILNSFKNSDIEIEIMPEHLIRSTSQSDILPDGSFMLKKNGKQALFLMENSISETVKSSLHKSLEEKIIRYVEIFASNDISLYEKYFRSQLNRFRLLYIINSHARLESIQKVIKQHDAFGFIWVTTYKEFQARGIEKNIFQIPGKEKYHQAII